MATHGVLRFMRVCFTRKKPKVSQMGFREDISMRRPLYLNLTEPKKTPEQEQTTKSFLVISLYSALAVKKNSCVSRKCLTKKKHD